MTRAATRLQDQCFKSSNTMFSVYVDCNQVRVVQFFEKISRTRRCFTNIATQYLTYYCSCQLNNPFLLKAYVSSFGKLCHVQRAVFFVVALFFRHSVHYRCVHMVKFLISQRWSCFGNPLNTRSAPRHKATFRFSITCGKILLL